MLRIAAVAATLLCLVTSAALAEESAVQPRSIDLADLTVLQRPSLAVVHTSLEGLAPVPADGVTLTLRCVIRDGRLSDCNASCRCDDASARVYLPAALQRAARIRFGPTSTKGEPTEGAQTRITIPIRSSDRFENPSVSFLSGDLLVFEAEPRGTDLRRYYPSAAIDRELEGWIDIVCVVQGDFTVACPDIRVSAKTENEEVLADFIEAAKRIIAIYRVAALTKEGKSSVGIGFRQRIIFRLV